jgi:hypothetical protein
MSNANFTIPLHLFYTETSIRNLDDSDLYWHVQKTTKQLGIPTPARASVKKIGDGTIFVELSCHPTVRSDIIVMRPTSNISLLLTRYSVKWRTP